MYIRYRGSALYPRPIPYEMWPKIMRTQCSISICLKMGIFWKVRKMSKTSVFQGFSRKWWKNDDPKPHQIRCRSDYWDFKPKSIRFGWNLIILQNKEWCRVAWSPKYSKMSPKIQKMSEWKYFSMGSFAFVYNSGVLSRGWQEVTTFVNFMFCAFSKQFLTTSFLYFLAAGLIFRLF
mgnify:CR=1 FL=1